MCKRNTSLWGAFRFLGNSGQPKPDVTGTPRPPPAGPVMLARSATSTGLEADGPSTGRTHGQQCKGATKQPGLEDDFATLQLFRE